MDVLTTITHTYMCQSVVEDWGISEKLVFLILYCYSFYYSSRDLRGKAFALCWIYTDLKIGASTFFKYFERKTQLTEGLETNASNWPSGNQIEVKMTPHPGVVFLTFLGRNEAKTWYQYSQAPHNAVLITRGKFGFEETL